ncbi:chaplin [Streptomyces sp. NPDC003522]
MKNLKRAAAVTTVAGGLVAAAAGGASADGVAEHAPGVVPGNVVQAPVHIPVDAVGNSVDVIGVLDPAFGDPGPDH